MWGSWRRPCPPACRLQLQAAVKVRAGFLGNGPPPCSTSPYPPPPRTGISCIRLACGKAVLTDTSNGDLGSRGLGLFRPRPRFSLPPSQVSALPELRLFLHPRSPPFCSQCFSGKLLRIYSHLGIRSSEDLSGHTILPENSTGDLYCTPGLSRASGFWRRYSAPGGNSQASTKPSTGQRCFQSSGALAPGPQQAKEESPSW